MRKKTPRLRERQTQLTRDEILKAARVLFAERGYTRTSVRDIATAAGVSAQTVYDSIGSKQAVVARLNDLIDAEARVRDLAEAALRSNDGTQVAATPATVTRSILENCGDIVHALVTGAAAEPDLAVALADGHRRHVAGARTTVDRLQELGALAAGLEPAAAVDTVAAVCDVQLALVLRDAYGWSLDRIESWMAQTSRALLLGEAFSHRIPSA